MSGTEETEMLYQIVTHGEAFCPSTMTKETPFANRKLLLEEITNNESNEMEEEKMEEIEIKEGHGDVEEEQGNKDTPFANRKLLEDDSTNNERNEMEEGQTEDNEIKEGHDDVEEKQDNKIELPIINISLFTQLHRDLFSWNIQLESRPLVCSESVICNFEIQEGQMEEFEKKERQKEAKDTPFANRKLLEDDTTNNERNEMEEGQTEENEIKEGQEKGRKAKGNKSLNARIMRVKRRTVDDLLYWFRCICDVLIEMGQMEEYKKKERQEKERKTKLDKILENWLKTEGKSADAVDFLRKYQPLPPKEAMSKKKRNMKHHGMLPMSGQTGRYVVQGGVQKERGKLIENPELSGKFDDAEKDIQELEQLLRCKVCLDSDACIVFLPCRHMATCEYCEGFLHHCPVCRSFIEEAVKINEE